MRIRTFVAGAALAMLLVVAVGGPASAASVTIVDFAFQPATVTISAGDSVTWTNNGPSQHTTTGGTWDSGVMNVGSSFTHTFNSTGTFPYACSIHPFMTGTVIIQAGGGGGGQGTLPSTGAGPGTAPLAWLGVLFLVTGGVVLYLLRRRRA